MNTTMNTIIAIYESDPCHDNSDNYIGYTTTAEKCQIIIERLNKEAAKEVCPYCKGVKTYYKHTLHEISAT